mgnify:FL=1
MQPVVNTIYRQATISSHRRRYEEFNLRLILLINSGTGLLYFEVHRRQYTTDTNMYLLRSFSHLLRHSSTSEKLQRVIKGETIILSPASAFTAAGILNP